MEIIILVFIYSLFTGGKIKHFEKLSIRWFLLLFFYLVVIIMIKTPFVYKQLAYRDLHLISWLSYGLLTVFLIVNHKLPGGKFIAVGALLNFLVISLNSGYMPVSQRALIIAGQHEVIHNLTKGCGLTHALTTSETWASFLGDIIPIPKNWIYSRVLSVGDVFIILGVSMLVIRTMKGKKVDRDEEH